MSRERPIAITFIGDCHIFAAVLLLLSLLPFMKQFGFNVLLPDSLSATALSEALIKILIAALIGLIFIIPTIKYFYKKAAEE